MINFVIIIIDYWKGRLEPLSKGKSSLNGMRRERGNCWTNTGSYPTCRRGWEERVEQWREPYVVSCLEFRALGYWQSVSSVCVLNNHLKHSVCWYNCSILSALRGEPDAPIADAKEHISLSLISSRRTMQISIASILQDKEKTKIYACMHACLAHIWDHKDHGHNPL